MRGLVLLTLSALVMLASACGDSDPQTSPSPPSSPSATPSVTASPSPGTSYVPEGEPVAAYNISEAATLFRGFAEDPGDLATSGYSLTKGDFNGDGVADGSIFTGGTLACAGNCTLDTSGCFGRGDGLINDVLEQCDDPHFGVETCQSNGSTAGFHSRASH